MCGKREDRRIRGLAEDWRIRKIFEYLERNNPISVKDLSKNLDISERCIRKRVREMEEARLVSVYSLYEIEDERIRKNENWSFRKQYVFLEEREESKLFRKILEKY